MIMLKLSLKIKMINIFILFYSLIDFSKIFTEIIKILLPAVLTLVI